MQSGLSQYRKAAGYLTQESLASVLKVKRSSVAKWETGRRFPRTTLLPQIAERLNCSTNDVILAIEATRKNHLKKPPDDRTA